MFRHHHFSPTATLIFTLSQFPRVHLPKPTFFWLLNTYIYMAAATGTGSPCGACKFLRRKCAADCIFAPYFCSDQGPARFAAIHKVFGASNVSKMLMQVSVHDRCDAVVTIDYEARARIKDPVYGCVAHIFALQQQVLRIKTFCLF